MQSRRCSAEEAKALWSLLSTNQHFQKFREYISAFLRSEIGLDQLMDEMENCCGADFKENFLQFFTQMYSSTISTKKDEIIEVSVTKTGKVYNLPKLKKRRRETSYKEPKKTRKQKRAKADKWAEEDDEKLQRLVADHGEDWPFISNELGRTPGQCFQHWKRVLDPSIKKGVWTEAEQKALLKAVREFGFQWSRVAQAVPGRTDTQCRYFCLTKKFQRLLKSGKDEELSDFERL